MKPIIYLLLVFLLIELCAGCGLIFRRSQTIDQTKGVFATRNLKYEGIRRRKIDDSVYVEKEGILLFSNGYIAKYTVAKNSSLEKLINNRNQKDIYRNRSGLEWGKYYLSNDTIYIEHIANLSSGGGFKVRSLRYTGLYNIDSLTIYPGPELIYGEEPLQYIYPKDGIVVNYVGQLADSIIDPRKVSRSTFGNWKNMPEF